MKMNILRAVIVYLSIIFFSSCATSPPIAGTYGAKIPAASSPGRVIHLTLTDDKRVEMRTDYMNNRAAVIETGTWKSLEGGDISVAITDMGYQIYEKPEVIVFRFSGETLEAIEYDPKTRGSEGLSLQKQPDITDREWLLKEIQYFNDVVVKPASPAHYTLQLFHNGTVLVKADCNRGTGSFVMTGKKIEFQKLGYTHEICLPGSLSGQYIGALDAAFSCMVRGEYLFIYSSGDVGVLKFVPAE